MEMLVTLGLVGVIAAITISPLVQNIQDSQNKSSYKEATSIISQAIMNINNDGGSLVGKFTDQTSFVNLFQSQLTSVKTCASGTSKGNCWTSTTSYLDGTVKTDMWNAPTLVLSNGITLMFSMQSTSCEWTGFGALPNGKGACGYVAIDVNGANKPPNTFGKDMYLLIIQSNNIVPAGADGTNWAGNACVGATGWDSGLACSKTYLLN